MERAGRVDAGRGEVGWRKTLIKAKANRFNPIPSSPNLPRTLPINYGTPFILTARLKKLKTAARKKGACSNPTEAPSENVCVNIGAATPSPMIRRLVTAPCNKHCGDGSGGGGDHH